MSGQQTRKAVDNNTGMNLSDAVLRCYIDLALTGSIADESACGSHTGDACCEVVTLLTDVQAALRRLQADRDAVPLVGKLW